MGSPPRVGSKMPTPKIAQTKSGIFLQVMPGARSVWIVTMKLRPLTIDERPMTNTPRSAGVTAVRETTL
jgi:hypothetical protein